MVPTNDFSGLAISACALSRAAALAPIDSLERCMACLRVEKIKAHRARLRALGADAVADRLLGVVGHEALELGLGFLMLGKGLSRRPERGGELGPCIRRAHVDDPPRLDARPRWLDPEEARGLAALHAAPELLLGGEQKML